MVVEKELNGDSADTIINNAMEKLKELQKGIEDLGNVLGSMERLVQDAELEPEETK